MPFKPWVQNISPLAWMLGVSAVTNVVTMLAVLYIAFGTPKVYVSDGYVDVTNTVHVNVRNQVDVRDRPSLRVQVVP